MFCIWTRVHVGARETSLHTWVIRDCYNAHYKAFTTHEKPIEMSNKSIYVFGVIDVRLAFQNFHYYIWHPGPTTSGYVCSLVGINVK